MNLNKLIKREILVTAFTVMVLSIGAFVFTYAVYMVVGKGQTNTVAYGDLIVEMCSDSTCSSILSNAGNIIGTSTSNGSTIQLALYPQSDEEGLASTPYAFVIQNTGDLNAYVNLQLSTTISNASLSSTFHNYMRCAHSIENSSNPSVRSDFTNSFTFANNIYLEAGEYEIVYVWIWGTEDMSNDMIGTTVTSNVNAAGYYFPDDPSSLHTRFKTLTINLNGGSQTKTYSGSYAPGDIISIESPTKSGYGFAGWTINGTGTNIAEEIFMMGSSDTTITANWLENNSIYTYNYNGGEQTLTIPATGWYQIEAWGAQGGSYSSTYYGGYGAYSTGTLSLQKDQLLYINIGGSPENLTTKVATAGGYNGGGANAYRSDVITEAGGGATHIATSSGLLSTLSSNKSSILIVAGGGGGATYYTTSRYGIGGSGGGGIGNSGIYSTGSDCESYGTGGTQLAGGSTIYYAGSGATGASGFGFGGTGASSGGGAGGGGGYYGGGGAYCIGGAGGGSSYVGYINFENNYSYCYNCTTSTYTYSTTNVSASPTSNYAKSGSGYAIITYLGTN